MSQGRLIRFPKQPGTPASTRTFVSAGLDRVCELYAESLAVQAAKQREPNTDLGDEEFTHFRRGVAAAVAAILSQQATMAAGRPVTVSPAEAELFLERQQTSAATIEAAIERRGEPPADED